MRACLASICGMALLLAPVASEAPASEQVILRLGTNAPEGSPWADGCMLIAKSVEKSSKGQVRIKVFPSGMLGDEVQLMESVGKGSLDGAAVSVAATFDQLPELSALELPFLMHDEAEADRIFPRLWPTIEKTVAQRKFKALVYTSIGFRNLGTRRPISSLQELRAVRFRSQPSPLHDRMWNLLGVKHTALGLPQVMHALDRNEVDGFDSALVWMFGAGWHQHIKQLSLSRHIYQPGIVILGPSAVAKIPANLRSTVLDSLSAGISRDNVKRVREIERSLLESLPGLGVEVKPISDGFRADLQKTLLPMRAEWRKNATPAGRKLLDAVESELARGRKL